MENLQRLLTGLELPEDADFREAMLPELQRQMTDLNAEEWAILTAIIDKKDSQWHARLIQTLSPPRHGAPSIALLFKLAKAGGLVQLESIAEKLLAAQAINPAEKDYLAALLKAQSTDLTGHHRKMRIAELINNLEAPYIGPSIQEASEYSVDHRERLEHSRLAACYYCQTVFDPVEISEYIDDGSTALCPFCGIDAVIPSAAGYVFSAVNLEALNAFWFQ
jgi:hypothetical protein